MSHYLNTICGFVFFFAGVASSFAQTNYFVSPEGSNQHSGLSPSEPLRFIQKAVELAQPGDTIHLAPGHYSQDIMTIRSGSEGQEITITGPSTAVVHGRSSNRIVQILHDHIVLQGFTLDGLREGGDPERMGSYREKLLFAIGYDVRDGVNHMRLLGMTFRNAGEECVHLKYFAQHNEIAYSHFENCGVYDFRFGSDGVVGEAIYLGTSSTQWDDGRNITFDPDETYFNWIHHNTMNTQGNECVEAKEGSSHNVIEYNVCTGQKDPNSGGIVSRGDANLIRFNEIYGNVGAGIRLGGHQVNGVQYGVDNDVYGNIIYGNEAGGIKVMVIPQQDICENRVDNAPHNMIGDYRDDYDPTTSCGLDLP